MRINIYSQELTPEVLSISKVSNTGIEYKAVQFVLHSSPMLHHPPADDDRSAVTFWLPQSDRGLREFKSALERARELVCDEMDRRFNAVYDANARRRGQYEDSESTVHSGGSAVPERQGIEVPVSGTTSAKETKP